MNIFLQFCFLLIIKEVICFIIIIIIIVCFDFVNSVEVLGKYLYSPFQQKHLFYDFLKYRFLTDWLVLMGCGVLIVEVWITIGPLFVMWGELFDKICTVLMKMTYLLNVLSELKFLDVFSRKDSLIFWRDFKSEAHQAHNKL